MNEASPTVLPWDRYNRSRLRPGTSYPVGQGEIEVGLRAAGVRVSELVMFRRDAILDRRLEDPDRLSLLGAIWDKTITQLWIYAIPSVRRARAHEVLIREALPIAYRWLAEVPKRGNAWSATRHELATYLVGTRLTVAET